MMLCFNLGLSSHTMTKRKNMRRLCSESEDNLVYDGSLDFLSKLVISGLIMFEVARYLQIISYLNL